MHDFQALRRTVIRYWERRRIVYNLALVPPAFFGYMFCSEISAAIGDPRRLSTGAIIGLFVLSAVGANICYTCAYALEFLFGSDAPESHWPRWGRTVALVSGILFAMVLALVGGLEIGTMAYTYR